MRDPTTSHIHFPSMTAQGTTTANRATLTLTPTTYDRRALDTRSPMPLINSLTHLTYLTSTVQQVRDKLTVDGGLERLVRIMLTSAERLRCREFFLLISFIYEFSSGTYHTLWQQRSD